MMEYIQNYNSSSVKELFLFVAYTLKRHGNISDAPAALCTVDIA